MQKLGDEPQVEKIRSQQLPRCSVIPSLHVISPALSTFTFIHLVDAFIETTYKEKGELIIMYILKNNLQ